MENVEGYKWEQNIVTTLTRCYKASIIVKTVNLAVFCEDEDAIWTGNLKYIIQKKKPCFWKI